MPADRQREQAEVESTEIKTAAEMQPFLFRLIVIIRVCDSVFCEEYHFRHVFS